MRDKPFIDDREPKIADPPPPTSPEVDARAAILARDFDREVAKYAKPRRPR